MAEQCSDRRVVATRIFGLLTAGYGAYAVARPHHLTRQVGIDPHTARRTGHVLGTRDMLSGAAIVITAPSTTAGIPLLVRAVFDGIDTIGFGVLSPSQTGRRKAAGAAATWGVAASLLYAAHRRAAGSARR